MTFTYTYAWLKAFVSTKSNSIIIPPCKSFLLFLILFQFLSHPWPPKIKIHLFGLGASSLCFHNTLYYYFCQYFLFLTLSHCKLWETITSLPTISFKYQLYLYYVFKKTVSWFHCTISVSIMQYANCSKIKYIQNMLSYDNIIKLELNT